MFIDMIVRTERPEDYSEIYELVKIAFQTAKVSNGKEQDFVNYLRASKDYVSQLALVVEENSKIIGQIMFTTTFIRSGDKKYQILLLAPVAVLVEHRGKGIGASLIIEGMKRAKDLGYQAVILVGDPAFYCRFGFKPTVDYGIRNTNNIPDEYVLACELIPSALAGIAGTIHFDTGS